MHDDNDHDDEISSARVVAQARTYGRKCTQELIEAIEAVTRVFVRGTYLYCILKDPTPGKVRAEGRHLIFDDDARRIWIPKTWRRAIWTYARKWPNSAEHLTPLLDIEQDVLDACLIELAKEVLETDSVGRRGSARTLGAFARAGEAWI